LDCQKPFAATKPFALPAAEPATQVRVEHDADGTVRLKQMAFSKTAGWYVQKSFCIPAELLPSVLVELRKANCLNPKYPLRSTTPTRPLRLRLAD
jgi:hypothetical protein